MGFGCNHVVMEQLKQHDSRDSYFLSWVVNDACIIRLLHVPPVTVKSKKEKEKARERECDTENNRKKKGKIMREEAPRRRRGGRHR